MTTINSVLGPLNSAEMGFTLCHEHVLETSAGIPHVYPTFIDREESIRESIITLRQAYDEGIRTIVDVTTMDLGRDVRFLEHVSKESGVQIICTTGIWLDIPRVFWNANPDLVSRLFIQEIVDGIEETGIKAGIIKVASGGRTVTPEEQIILRAAARAHKVTKVPITTHSLIPGRIAGQQVRLLEGEGVDMNRICVGHCDDTCDIDYLITLLKKGVWLGLDRFRLSMSRPERPNWEERAETTRKLIDAGFEHKIMLSHDWTVTSPFLSIAKSG